MTIPLDLDNLLATIHRARLELARSRNRRLASALDSLETGLQALRGPIHPYRLSKAQRTKLSRVPEWNAPKSTRTALPSGKIWYRVAPLPRVARSLSWNDLEVTRILTDQGLYETLCTLSTEGGGWISLDRRAHGKLKGFRSTLWWTSHPLSDKLLNDQVYSLGIPTDYIGSYMALIRADNVAAPGLPTAVQGYHSPIFDIPPEEHSLPTGFTISLRGLKQGQTYPLGYEEFVSAGDLPLRGCHLLPIDATTWQLEVSLDSTDEELLRRLIAFYRSQKGLGGQHDVKEK